MVSGSPALAGARVAAPCSRRGLFRAYYAEDDAGVTHVVGSHVRM